MTDLSPVEPARTPGEPGAPKTPGASVKQCPFCLEQIHAEAVRCRHCRTWLRGNPLQNEWFRSPAGVIAGVCQGLSEQFQISATVIRVLFLLTTVFGAGMGLVLYLALWFIMPKAQGAGR